MGMKKQYIFLQMCVVRTRCTQKFCIHKRLFNLSAEMITNVLEVSAYVRTNLLFCRTNKIDLLDGNQAILIFEDTRKSFRDVIGDVYCSKCKSEKCVYISANQNCEKLFYDWQTSKTSCDVLNIPIKDKNWQSIHSEEMVKSALPEKRVVTTKQHAVLFPRIVSPPITINQPRIWNENVETLAVYSISVWISHKLIQSIRIYSRISFYPFSVNS